MANDTTSPTGADPTALPRRTPPAGRLCDPRPITFTSLLVLQPAIQEALDEFSASQWERAHGRHRPLTDDIDATPLPGVLHDAAGESDEGRVVPLPWRSVDPSRT